MHRRGHVGITLLGVSPVLYLLLPDRPFLSLLSLGVFVVEPLPDYDQRIEWFEHRKTSHSLLTAGIIGGVCAGLGWMGGSHVTVPVADWLLSIAASDDTTLAWIAAQLGLLDAPTLALVGVWIGTGGVLLHLAGDIITVSGIQPLLPFSGRTISLSSLYADNRTANIGFFLLGWLSLLVVSLLTTPLGDAVRTISEIIPGIWT
ncbi:metal-dependent hydrolase [Halocatena pleomorpha]|uniref:Metal-dependent hydrolase n=1 Tax=Halocatena pleomorpha TaxID=1785090 RepID=A0A3P3R9C6_9EURY|nr:metal-dependent hydrolase [Halocatena pleomorpha]RRJ30057.1 hypothetical protein EIK79_10750 [Halocatena pleomorpha]